MKSNSNDVNYNLTRGIVDKDIEASVPPKSNLDPLGGLLDQPKRPKSKRKAENHEAIVPDPRVQLGESIILLASLSSQVGRISLSKIMHDLNISVDQLESPLSLITHNEMVKILPNTKHPLVIVDYDIQLTDKGRSLAAFLIGAEADRHASLLKKAEDERRRLLDKKYKKSVLNKSKPKIKVDKELCFD